jgi:ketosteroid isomerase-like protein
MTAEPSSDLIAGRSQEIDVLANRAAVERFLDALVRQDIEAVVQVHTPDAVLEFPYAPPGFPARVEGHDAIRAFETPITESVASSSFHDLVFRPVAGANQGVATYRGEVQLHNGRDYNNEYCLVIEFQDGRFHRVSEYFNPVVVMESGLIAES